MEPPLAPSVLAARSKQMKYRLSTSSLVLGGEGQETRDWSLSSTQPRPVGSGAMDRAQRETNLAMKKGVLAEFTPSFTSDLHRSGQIGLKNADGNREWFGLHENKVMRLEG